MMVTATSGSGREYPIGRRYPPPSEKICDFLIATLPLLSDTASYYSQDMAKQLIELYSGPGKRGFHSNNIAESFPWMYQAGLLDYSREWHVKGGYRIILWRDAEPDEVKRILTERPTYLNGEPLGSPTPAAYASSEGIANEIVDVEYSKNKKKKKKKKRCCENPRIVRSKKTGKRRCKNCGAKMKSKKKDKEKTCND